MTQHYPGYTTIADVQTYLGSTATAENTLLLDLIRATSQEIDALCNRAFYPLIDTRYYDTPSEYQLDLDADLLELTTLSNPSGTTVDSGDYTLIPYNGFPKYAVRLLPEAGWFWGTNANGGYSRAVLALGVWGFHTDYDAAWNDIAATLAAAIATTSATSFTCTTTGKVRAGDLLKIDSEYIYASAVSTGATDTVTCVRGVNGSTAATHLISTAIYRWYFPELQALCTEAVVARHRLKNNPVGERVQIGEYSFSTPQDVTAYLDKRLKLLGFKAFVP